jgi:hypothetical protein
MTKLITAVGSTVAAFILVALILAFPVKWLANWVLSPALLAYAFGGPLTVWKAWGLSTLGGLIVGKTGGGK